MRKRFVKGKSGLFALGFIQNDSGYMAELLRLANQKISKRELSAKIDESYEKQLELNYHYDPDGNLASGDFDDRKTCRYAIYTGYDVPMSSPSDPGEKIYAVFAKDQYGNWIGVRFFTKPKLEKYYNSYRFGNISFSIMIPEIKTDKTAKIS